MTDMNIHPVIERKALALAAKQGVPLDKLIEEALVRMLEDEHDIAAAEKALRDYDPANSISAEQMRRELGLDA